MINKAKNGYQISFIVVLIVVALSICVFVGSILAWLTKEYDRETTGQLALGTVGIVLVVNSAEIAGTTYEWDSSTSETKKISITSTTPIEIASDGDTIRDLDIKMKNTGNIDALVRATFSLYCYDDSGNKVVALISSGTQVSGVNYVGVDTTGWVQKLPNANVASGYLFYNAKLEPYTDSYVNTSGNVTTNVINSNLKSIITSITTTQADVSKTFYLDITLDAIAYAGNIYKKTEDANYTTSDVPVEAYPFGSKDKLPATWTVWN